MVEGDPHKKQTVSKCKKKKKSWPYNHYPNK